MKKTLTWLVLLAAGATLLYAATYRQNLSNAGMQFGTSRSDRMGWWAQTPVTQTVVNVSGIHTSIAPVAISTTLSNLCAELARMGIIRTN